MGVNIARVCVNIERCVLILRGGSVLRCVFETVDVLQFTLWKALRGWVLMLRGGC